MSRPAPVPVLEIPAALTICDARGTVLAMNRAAARLYRGRGGDYQPIPIPTRVRRPQ